MITVYIPDNFIPERSYIVKTLLHHYLGCAIHIVHRPGQLHYELCWAGKTLIIRDHFFGKTIIGESYLHPGRIPEGIQQARHPALDGILILYGEDDIEIQDSRVDCRADLFAGAFFMLTRWEESFGMHEDQHGRFPADKALVVKEGFILRPVVDEYAALISKLLRSLGYDVPASITKFKVIPTCDVDTPYYWGKKPAWRLLAGRLLRHKSFKQFLHDRRIMHSMKKGDAKDPFDTFEYLMSLGEQHGVPFTFYMIAGGETSFEGFYRIENPGVIALMKSFLQRGHEIGIHPSYNAFNDQRKIERERKGLEKAAGIHIVKSRQHYLRFAVPATWRHLYDSYIKEDSTLGYAAEPGFRCGTCKSFPVFDVHSRKEIPLMERPLVIMDVSLKLYKQFSIEEATDYCSKIVHQVKKHNGELVFLWHNSSMSEVDDWQGWDAVLEYLASCE